MGDGSECWWWLDGGYQRCPWLGRDMPKVLESRGELKCSKGCFAWRECEIEICGYGRCW